ncbi:MAG: hypothetical protein KF859_04180 [Phycisphaeraceae bacterium]|nr:hypothetical protein [Phycisphaeraceae bacterium]
MKKLLNTVILCALAGAPSAASAVGEVYAFDLRFAAQSNLFTFAANDPLNQTQIGPVGGLNYTTFAMDFNGAGTALYAIDHSLGQNATRLGTIDTTTGVFNPGPSITGGTFGDINATTTGLTITGNDTFYASKGNVLHTINPVTGVATQIGGFFDATGASIGTVIDIAADNNGRLFAHALGTAAAGGGALYEVDPATGVSTFIGRCGIATSFAQGMDFDPTSNLLYAALYTSGGNGSYGVWNTNDGSWTEILPLASFPDPTPNGRELEMAIRVPTPGVLGMLAVGAPMILRRRR